MDFPGGKTHSAQYRIGIRAVRGRRVRHAAGSARVARGRGRLGDPVQRDVGVAGQRRRVRGRFGEAQHRRKADVRALHKLAPLLASLLAHNLAQAALLLGPAFGVVLLAELVLGKPRLVLEQGIKLRLDGADSDILAVGAFVGVVKMRGAVEQIGFAPIGIPQPGGVQGVHHPHQLRRAIDHGRIDNLPLTGTGGLQQRGENAVDQQHGAAPEVADEIERRQGAAAALAVGEQRPAERDVVDIVAGRACQRTVLPPAGHAREHQTRIALPTRLRADTELFAHTGAIGIDQHIGVFEHAQQGLYAAGLFQIQDHGLFAAATDPGQRWRGVAGGAIDANQFRALVGKQHAGHGRRADTGQFNDRKSV